MVVVNQNFSVIRGSTRTINGTLTDEETGDPINLAQGQGITWHVLLDESSTTPVIHKQRTAGITVPDALNGMIQITLQASETAALSARHYFHVLWVFTSGGVKTPFWTGRLEVSRAGPGI